MADHEDTLADYEEDTTEITTTVVPAAAADTVKKGSYVSVHATGFKDFLLHEPLMKALTDAAFEHPSEGPCPATFPLRHQVEQPIDAAFCCV